MSRPRCSASLPYVDGLDTEPYRWPVNEAMARHYFGDQNPIGRRLGTGRENSSDFEIVGVAKDARFSTLRKQAPLMMYFPARQRRMDRVSALQVRALANPVAVAAAVRREVQAVDKRLLVDVNTHRSGE